MCHLGHGCGEIMTVLGGLEGLFQPCCCGLCALWEQGCSLHCGRALCPSRHSLPLAILVWFPGGLSCMAQQQLAKLGTRWLMQPSLLCRS